MYTRREKASNPSFQPLNQKTVTRNDEIVVAWWKFINLSLLWSRPKFLSLMCETKIIIIIITTKRSEKRTSKKSSIHFGTKRKSCIQKRILFCRVQSEGRLHSDSFLRLLRHVAENLLSAHAFIFPQKVICLVFLCLLAINYSLNLYQERQSRVYRMWTRVQ